MECSCYVTSLPPEEQFVLRRGAHSISCPVYRESLDPVDRIYDREVREHFLRQYREAMADPMADPYYPFNGDREAFYNDRAERMP